MFLILTESPKCICHNGTHAGVLKSNLRAYGFFANVIITLSKFKIDVKALNKNAYVYGTVRWYGALVRGYGTLVRWYGTVVRCAGTVVRCAGTVVRYAGAVVRYACLVQWRGAWARMCGKLVQCTVSTCDIPACKNIAVTGVVPAIS